MFLSSMFSFAQKAEYEIIHNKPWFYEFNLKRDKIFIYDYDKNLSVYDVNTGKNTLIEANVEAETGSMIKNPFIITTNDKLMFITETHVCEIKDNKLIPKAEFAYEEYRYGAITSETIERDDKKVEELNKLFAEYTGNNVQRYDKHHDIFVFNYQDEHSIAIYYDRLIGVRPLSDENIVKINQLAKIIENNIDSSYYIDIKKHRNVINYFENKKISIEEKTYSCKKESFMSLVSQCKYKIKIKYKDKTVNLKDEYRKTRFSFWDDKDLGVNLNTNIPFSRYITDNKGNIYLSFCIDGELKLIKIPVKQFEK